MEDLHLNLDELTPQELALAEIEDNKTKLTWSQKRAMKVESMMETREDKETGETYPIGLNQDAIKVFLKEAIKVQGHPTLGGVYIYNEKEHIWKVEQAPQAVLVENISRTIKEVYDWEFFPNNRFGNDISRAVKDYLNEVAPLYGENSPLATSAKGHLMAFTNGTYNFITNEITDTTPDDFQTMKLPYDLIPHEDNEEMLATQWLKWLTGESHQTIEELIGFCLHRGYDKLAAFAFFINSPETVSGGNGKSQVLNFIKLVLGAPTLGDLSVSPYVKDLSLEQIAGSESKFNVSKLRGALANINDDTDKTFISKTGTLKNLTAGGSVNAEIKGSKVNAEFVNQAKLIFSMNDLPTFRDESDGMSSRMIIVPFLHKVESPEQEHMYKGKDAPFNSEKQAKYMTNKESLGKYAWHCIQAFRKAKATGKRNPFYRSELAREMVEHTMYTNNPLENFLTDCGYEITGNSRDCVITESILEEYEKYSKGNTRSINNLKAELEAKGVKTSKRNGYDAQGRPKIRVIKRQFKDTDSYTVPVWTGIRKVEDE